MNHTLSPEKLQQYFAITGEALALAKNHLNPEKKELAQEVWDMAQRYSDDARFFLEKKEDAVLAFAALNYAHGWLDCGARLGLFQVQDSRLFAVDGGK